MKKKRLFLMELALLSVLATGCGNEKSKAKLISVGEISKSSDISLDRLDCIDDVITYDEMKVIIEENKRQELIDECKEVVDRYSNIYEINPDIIYKIIKENTNDFSSTNFKNFKNIYSEEENYNSFDSQVLMLVHDVYKYPNKYGYDNESIKNNDTHGDICDMTIREFIYKNADILDIDKDTALAIACAESGYFTDGIAVNNKNPFALNINGYIYYDNLYLGILEGLINLKIGYSSLDINSMASIYCPYYPDIWIDYVNDVKNELSNGKKLYDEEENVLIYN
ncbi:MAG: glucosaminidase domain-containing protein [Bacilli bacterium]|nr:glucosaminidase domain-containing protein [Bacilli bacterium]